MQVSTLMNRNFQNCASCDKNLGVRKSFYRVTIKDSKTPKSAPKTQKRPPKHFWCETAQKVEMFRRLFNNSNNDQQKTFLFLTSSFVFAKEKW